MQLLSEDRDLLWTASEDVWEDVFFFFLRQGPQHDQWKWFGFIWCLFCFLFCCLDYWGLAYQIKITSIQCSPDVRGFPIAVKRKLGNNANRKQCIPKWLWLRFALRLPIPLPCCHSKVAVELLDRRACFPSDREIRGCRGPTGARRQIKQGGYPWSDTWSHFKGWERHWSPVISSERQSVRVKGGEKKKLYQLGWYERGRMKHHLNVMAWWPSSIWRSDGAKSVFCWNGQVQSWDQVIASADIAVSVMMWLAFACCALIANAIFLKMNYHL